ncbi:MAG: hypothetical protein L0154_12700 [Chloroflexi bacterium]|nr:hypothetical protein [Chloroflexota bacterium]
MAGSGAGRGDGGRVAADGALMWKYVWLVGGFGGLLISLLVWRQYPQNLGRVNLIVEHTDGIYRYDVESAELHHLLPLPLAEDGSQPTFRTVRTSPNGHWALITHTGRPDRAFVVDVISDRLSHRLEFELHDGIDYFGTWSPDSRHIGWVTYTRGNGADYVLLLNVITGQQHEFPLPSGYFTAGRWRDDRTVEIWSASRAGAYVIDIYSGDMLFVPDVSYSSVRNCCAQAGYDNDSIYLYTNHQREFILKTDTVGVLASPNLEKIAYLQLIQNQPHLFVYTRNTGDSTQITSTTLPLPDECLNVFNVCRTLRAWSPDDHWILLNMTGELHILDAKTGQLYPVALDGRVTSDWTDISFANDRSHFPLWLVASAGFLMLGMWRAVR